MYCVFQGIHIVNVSCVANAAVADLLPLRWNGQVDLDTWCVTSHICLECQKTVRNNSFVRAPFLRLRTNSRGMFLFSSIRAILFIQVLSFILFWRFIVWQFCFLRSSGCLIQTNGERGQRTHRFVARQMKRKQISIACRKRRTNFGAWKKPQNK